jgi:heptosyltransferase-2
MDFNERCYYYRTDRPCVYHKADGRDCPGCPDARPVEERILLIKLGAMGDVLRTTALLEPLQRRYPRGAIHWLVQPESAPLLQNNPFIREIWRLTPETGPRLQMEKFDLCINLDLGADSLALASAARAEAKLGYGLGARGEVARFNPEAEEWFRLSHSDRLKRENEATYQDHMMRILGLPGYPGPIIVNCPSEEREYAGSFLRSRLERRPPGPVVGFNFGAGGRWQLKRWPLESYLELGWRLSEEKAATILLLGGPGEAEDTRRLVEESRGLFINTGNDNPLPRFAALVGLCDVVVTGDTLALHMALGLGRRAVAMFGPTSASEIEMYGLGTKITPPMECLCCYRSRCSVKPSCMEMISVETVFHSVVHEIEKPEPDTVEKTHEGTVR